MKIARLILGLAAVSMLASCASAKFERDWKTAVAEHDAGKTDAITGPWTGSWTTETNGHTGDLRCIVSETTPKSDTYNFRYHATWAKFMQGGYKADYAVKKSGKGYAVTGSKKLGIFGDFSHDGRIQGDQFNATYEASTGDKGGFFMKRPE